MLLTLHHGRYEYLPGATYWSVSREDNGSLPLNWLSTDEALLEWGICDLAIAHIGCPALPCYALFSCPLLTA